MKGSAYFQKLAHVTTLLSILLVALSPSMSRAVDTGAAEVKSTIGVATYAYPDGRVGEVKPGIKLQAGAIISTAKRSKVNLWLGENGEALQIEEDATLVLVRLDVTKEGSNVTVDTRLVLKYGGVSGNVKKLSADSRFEVAFPAGVVRIRGTTWRILPDNKVVCGFGSVTVTYGEAGVESPSVRVPAGDMALPPQKPRAAPVIVTPAPASALGPIAPIPNSPAVPPGSQK